MRKRIAFGILILLVVVGCTRSGKKTTEVSARKIDSLRSHFEFLQSEIALNWAVMMEDDDEKLFSIKRLLEEVSYTGAYNEKQFNLLMAALEAVKNHQYDQKTMGRSAHIDEYDSMSTHLISEVIEFAQHHPEFDNYPLMAELVNEIMEAQYEVFFFRVRYDNVAFEYNLFIEENSEIMDLISNGKENRMAVFSLPE
jgi:hypothetical protein